MSCVSKNEGYNLIIESFNANPINLFARFKEKNIKDIKECINYIKLNKELTINEKKEQIQEIKDNLEIKIKYNTIIINNL